MMKTKVYSLQIRKCSKGIIEMINSFGKQISELESYEFIFHMIQNFQFQSFFILDSLHFYNVHHRSVLIIKAAYKKHFNEIVLAP